MKILSIQTGLPKTVHFNGRDTLTGIFKDPVKGPVMLRKLHLDGDGQADLKVHGGVDKALYAYGEDAYPQWRKVRPSDKFDPGAVGENLTMDYLPEDKIFIGDVFALGQSIVEVSQPRFPCFKLGIKFQDNKVLKDFVTVNRPGVRKELVKFLK